MAKGNLKKSGASHSQPENAGESEAKSEMADEKVEANKSPTEKKRTGEKFQSADSQNTASNPSPAAATAATRSSSPGGGRGKKNRGTAAKTAAGRPSDSELESLRLAVAAAGDAENLMRILQHVDSAGGPAAVVESIEAYRALKSAVEVSLESPHAAP